MKQLIKAITILLWATIVTMLMIRCCRKVPTAKYPIPVRHMDTLSWDLRLSDTIYLYDTGMFRIGLDTIWTFPRLDTIWLNDTLWHYSPEKTIRWKLLPDSSILIETLPYGPDTPKKCEPIETIPT